MDSIASFTIETGGQKCHMMSISRQHGDVMPSDCLVKGCYGIIYRWKAALALQCLY